MASKSFQKCVICGRRRSSVSSLFLAALPLDPARCQQWVEAIGQQDLVHLPIEKLHELKFVCSIHFDAKDFNKKGNRLLKTAVPTLNLPQPLPRELFVDFPQRIGSQKAQFPRGLISQLNIEVGINPVLIEVMKKEVATWNNNKKICSIIFDEIHLNERLSFNQNKDIINGFVHLDERHKGFADQALVFMLRGALSKWQQPFAFYFCKGATNPAELKIILKEVVTASIEIGLRPIATICNQGLKFRLALGELQQETRRAQLIANLPTDNTVELCGVKLNVIYDPSHIIEGLRNNFLNKFIELDGNISKWQDIVEVYLVDCNHAENKRRRLLHKLSDNHVIPEKMTNRNKMKVKTAAQVFSSTVAATLAYTSQFSQYADGRPVSDTLPNTAKTVKFFDNLFDSINGAPLHHKQPKRKELRKAVTATTKHHTFWKDAITILEKIRFLDEKGNIISVPTLKCCVTTLKSLIRLWQVFQEQGLKVMHPHYFNLDPIQYFFGQVRAYNFRHNDPDCYSFICTFRSLLITRMVAYRADQLLSMSQILNLTPENLKSTTCEVECETQTISPTRSVSNRPHHPHSVNDVINQARQERLKVHSRTYIAGWVVKKVLERTPCDECKIILKSESPLQIHKWVSHREFKQSQNRISYPSETAVQCFGTVMETTNIFLESAPHLNNISKRILTEIKSKMTYDINCPKHRNDEFILIVVKFAIHNWCSTINKILAGTDIVRLEKRVAVLPPIQKMAYEKFKSKLRIKSSKKYFFV